MSVAASDFVNSAKVMLVDGSEIGKRNSISRAYYAAYHEGLRAAGQLCPDLNDNFKMGSHERLIERFKNCASVQRGRNLAYILQSLKVLRHKADYNLSAEVSRAEAESHISTVEKFCGEVASLSAASSDAATG